MLNGFSRHSQARLLVAISTLLLPTAVFAQSSASNTQADTSNDTNLAVKLFSHDRAQTGTATLTQQSGAVKVQVVLDQAPSSSQTAAIVKGTCPALAASTGGSSSGSSSMGSGSMSGQSGSSSSMSSGATNSGMGASTGGPYPIGKLTASQGSQGQTTGVASGTIKGVTLSSLVSGTYALVIGTSSSTSGSALCGDLKSSLPPMTPAGSK